MNPGAVPIRARQVTSGCRWLIGVGLSVGLSVWPSGCGGGSTAPATGLTGVWNGTLSQPNGPVYKQFTYSMDLRASGSSVTGTARISLIGRAQYYGDFAVEGTVTGSQFDFTELRITAQVAPPSGSSWCLKRGTLMLGSSGRTLAGDWNSTGGCAPGTISLTRS